MSRYEQRREAQEIIPNLYLGPYQSSNKLEVLLGMGITHMYVTGGTCVPIGPEARADEVASASGISVKPP